MDDDLEELIERYGDKYIRMRDVGKILIRHFSYYNMYEAIDIMKQLCNGFDDEQQISHCNPIKEKYVYKFYEPSDTT